MTNRERINAILHYKPYDRMPAVHFGYWNETLDKWAEEGHITKEEAKTWGDGNPSDVSIGEKLGFDCNWFSVFHANYYPDPLFEREIIEEFPDGTKHVRNMFGVVTVEKPEAGSIPAEIEHLFKDRETWEKHYKQRYQWNKERITKMGVLKNGEMIPFDQGGLEFLKSNERDYMYGLNCGSLFGHMRDVIGVENISYLFVDDEVLYDEIIQTASDLCYQNVKYALESGAKFDFGHFWEDICFKNGPLVIPSVFEEKVGPHYKRITSLLNEYGIDIVSLDCDGWIDSLIHIWLDNGVNTMFPIEVGTWEASIAPWREKYGKELRGVGGMNKNVFAKDKAAIDEEIKRLKPLIELGGYIPCPDHRIPPDAKWDLVKYYCEELRKTVPVLD